ncbi:12864_t:CDS:1 [Funneliformis geosporum]|uniref:17804_t:CDS:1 n=1 Tax=Funneliformis geosporum TaxID=1117311 RepID=A0A9W4SEV4_9GLOM|nr:12864_t:CDS:1 [Funneliformis geosporum]CAI2167010.1 17804_t:CDS:1 [Funneliformis geosporum]
MTKQKSILNQSLTIFTTITASLTPSLLTPLISSLSSSPTSPTTKLPKEPPPTKQTKKHHRKLSLLYKQIEHLELKLLFKKAFIERELLCKLELARKIKEDASEFELNKLVELNNIRSRLLFLQTRDRQQISKDTRRKIEKNKFPKKNSSTNKSNFKTTYCTPSNNSLSNQDCFDKNASSFNENVSRNNKMEREICLENLSVDELLILLDQKENEMNSAIQSSQNQIEELLKDAYDYLEEEEYLKLDIHDIKLEIDDLETMCI